MSPQDFAEQLDRLGSDLDRWPLALRREAEDLLAVSEEARAQMAAMVRVEAWLRGSSVTPAGSVSTIASHAMRLPQLGRRRPWRQAAAGGAAIAATLLLGLFVGGIDLGGHEDTPGQLVASALEPTGPADVD